MSAETATENDSEANDSTGGFEAIIQVDSLETLFKSVNTLVDECRVHLTDDGLEITAVDPANVAMVDAELSADAFESYRADGGVIGLNVERILDVLKVPDSDDLANLYYDPETRKLVIEVVGLEYTLALIDPESIREEPDLPDLDLSSRIVIEGSQLDRALTAADIATSTSGSSSTSGHFSIRSTGDDAIFHFEAEGDTDDVDYRFDIDDALDMDPGDADSMFSLDYWKDIAKPIGSDSRVSIRVGHQFPGAIAYSDVDGRLHLNYQIAPRVQSD